MVGGFKQLADCCANREADLSGCGGGIESTGEKRLLMCETGERSRTPGACEAKKDEMRRLGWRSGLEVC